MTNPAVIHGLCAMMTLQCSLRLAPTMINHLTSYKVSIIIGTINKFSCMCVKLSYGNFLPNGIRHVIVNEVCDPTTHTCSIQIQEPQATNELREFIYTNRSRLTTMHGNINTVDWRNEAGPEPAYWKRRGC